MTVWTFAGTLILTAVALFFVLGFLTTYLRYRRTFVITCPENIQPAAVRVDAANAGRWAAVAGEPDLRLKSCTRWPEMAGCGQECLSQLEESPEACAVKNIVTAWYDGKICVYCKSSVGEIVWHERPPAVRTAEGAIREWKEVAPEQLPIVFRTSDPVCWHCYIVEQFRKDHAELVIERNRIEERPRVLQPSIAVY